MKKINSKRPIQLAVTLAAITLSSSYPALIANAASDDEEYKKIKNTQTLEEVVVSARREKQVFERDYRSIGGKRVFDGPYGNQDFIIAIGQELKNRGEKKRVFTRGLKMPQSYSASSLDRYHYPVTDECGIENFQFFEGGDDFRALGHKQSPKEMLIDVMTGGGPFAAPGVWGPYDQVRGRRHKMKMIMGDAKSDGMGLLGSSYAIGMKAKLKTYEMQSYGDKFSIAIDKTGQCLLDRGDEEAANRLISGK